MQKHIVVIRQSKASRNCAKCAISAGFLFMKGAIGCQEFCEDIIKMNKRLSDSRSLPKHVEIQV